MSFLSFFLCVFVLRMPETFPPVCVGVHTLESDRIALQTSFISRPYADRLIVTTDLRDDRMNE